MKRRSQCSLHSGTGVPPVRFNGSYSLARSNSAAKGSGTNSLLLAQLPKPPARVFPRGGTVRVELHNLARFTHRSANIRERMNLPMRTSLDEQISKNRRLHRTAHHRPATGVCGETG